MSGTPLFISLFNNLAVFVVVVAAYGPLCRWLEARRRGYRDLGIGVLFGLGAIAGMFAASPIADGAHVDLHNAFVILSGVQAGPIGAVVAAIFTAVYRVHLGGAGLPAGLAALSISALAGILIWRFRLFRRGVRWELLASAISALSILPTFLLIGTLDLGTELLQRLAVPYWVAMFITLFVVGHLLHRQDRMATIVAEQDRDRQRMFDFAQSASDWFWETDADLCITYLSAGFENGTGLAAADTLGRSIWSVEGHMEPDALERHKQTFANRQPFRNVEYERHTPAGEILYFKASGIPLFDGKTFLGYRGTGSNITARKLVEVELKRQQAIFRQTIDASPVLIHVRGHDGRIIYANAFAARRWGVNADDLTGKHLRDVVPIEYRNESGTAQRDAIVTRTKRPIQFFPETLTFIDGPCEMLISKIPVLDADGEIDFIVTVAVDNSEQERIKEDLRAAVAHAEQANRAKSRFLATMSHELRTPLNAIIGFSDVMRGEHFGPLGSQRYIAYADDIHESGTFLLELVSDLLNLSAIEAGKNVLNLRPISIDKVVSSAIEKLGLTASTKGLELNVELASDLEQVSADERAVFQIVLNLVSNALKFTNTGGITVAVHQTRGPSEDGDSVRLTVTDTGIGIPADLMPTISAPFVQVHKDAMVSNEGTGLGLSIVSSLVKAHGGTLTIESTPGEGTTVTVTFPNRPPAEQEEGTERRAVN